MELNAASPYALHLRTTTAANKLVVMNAVLETGCSVKTDHYILMSSILTLTARRFSQNQPTQVTLHVSFHICCCILVNLGLLKH